MAWAWAAACTGRSVVPTNGSRGRGKRGKFSGTQLSEWLLHCGVEGVEISSAPDLFPPEEGPFVLKPDNGAARRAKALVKTCLTSHAREIGEKAWPRFGWRSSERLGKPITFYTYYLGRLQPYDLSWTPLGTERTDEPQEPGGCGCWQGCWQGTISPISTTRPRAHSILTILPCGPRQSRRSGHFQHYSVCQTQNSPVISKYGSAGWLTQAGSSHWPGANRRLVSRWPQSILNMVLACLSQARTR